MEDVNLTHVYARLNFSGYIAPLNVNGPVRASWLKKEMVKELIRAGYDVELLNSDACPEFAAQLDAYRKALADKDYVGAKAAFQSSLDRDPNSATEAAIAAAQNTGTSPFNGEVDPKEWAPVNSQTSGPADNPLEDAVASSLKSVGESASNGNVGTGDILNGVQPQSSSEYDEEMNNLGNGVEAENGGGSSEFDPNEQSNGSDEPGSVTVTRKKKNRK